MKKNRPKRLSADISTHGVSHLYNERVQYANIFTQVKGPTRIWRKNLPVAYNNTLYGLHRITTGVILSPDDLLGLVPQL